MPRYSTERGVHLLTTDEVAEALGCSRSTAKRKLKGCYRELHMTERNGDEGRVVKTQTAFFDASSLLSPQGQNETTGSNVTDVTNDPVLPHHRVKTRPQGQNEKTATETAQTLAKHDHRVTTTGSRPQGQKSSHNSHTARLGNVIVAPGEAERLEIIRPILETAPRTSERRAAIQRAVELTGRSERTIYLWVTAAERHQPTKRITPPTAKRKVSLEQENLIIACLLSNTPETPVAQIRRTLLRTAPSVFTRHYASGRVGTLSADTVARVKNRLLADPNTAGLFATDDDKKEHLRVAVGKVFANYANQLWEMDMTRCDVMVIDPETGKIARPRIHAIIDVYSRCVPGLAFSFAEDQTQTDLALLRALVPKPAPYDTIWQVHGTPETLYWDNGKTYSSHHVERVCRELGIRSVHSTPRTSHTRGAIERFFGTLHSYEKTLPGYVGENAAKRSSETIKRLIKNTENWRDRDWRNPPARADRLPTLAEYQQDTLNWLLMEYHRGVYEGQPRIDRFLETAPASTLAVPDREALMLIIGQRETRVVNALGQIRLNNETWGIKGGALVNYAGRTVQVIRDQFAMGERERLIAYEMPHTHELRVVGTAEPVPEVAASVEADEWRRNAKAAAQEAQRAQAVLKREYADPTLTVSASLAREAEAAMGAAVNTPRLPQPERRFEALDGDVDAAAKAFAAIRPEDDPVYQKLQQRMKKNATRQGGDERQK